VGVPKKLETFVVLPTFASKASNSLQTAVVGASEEPLERPFLEAEVEFDIAVFRLKLFCEADGVAGKDPYTDPCTDACAPLAFGDVATNTG
jgi:hypothetical protein